MASPQQRSSEAEQILMSKGGWAQCEHCKAKLLSCSVKYHEKICPMALDANPDPIIYKARTCIKKAKDTHKSITEIQEQDTVDKAARVDAALQDLKSLKKDGEFLIKVSEQERDKFATQEQQYEKELESLTKEKEKYEKEKREKEAQKNSLEAQLHTLTANQDNCQRAFNDAQSRKIEADNSLKKARDKLEKEKRDKERAQGTGAFFGAVVGTLAFPPLGGVVGGALGAGVGTAVANSDVKSAENHVSDCLKQFSSAENSLNSARNSLQSSINQCQVSITQCDKEYKECHVKISFIKKLLTFLLDAICFWGIFINESKNAEEETSHLEEIIKITEEKKEYDLILSDGTKISANSFLEAWEKFAKHEKLIVASTDESETHPQPLPAAN
ncbi:PREDICTED: uncharacterized protein LOC109587643 [Amphimedon queenslandica]|uniref:Uncharacterized protein n=1 Tax=Amphimedon queenslandica TaxID=400682 RepID=A0A1X7TI58_AMPQE|nr:PREDICTED: uncharacterized protein LOC109587643 [Amphimedon queenslandica]|eukprot:XP_019859422.1 PREDICTED: uncharacterized protein LOC109587643 [Amphimedon queenslandica]